MATIREFGLNEGQFVDIDPVAGYGFTSEVTVKVLDAASGEVLSTIVLTRLRKDSTGNGGSIPFSFCSRKVIITARWVEPAFPKEKWISYTEEGMKFSARKDGGPGYEMHLGDFWHHKHWDNLHVYFRIGTAALPSL